MWYRVAAGWEETEACSRIIAFSKNDGMYRLGCDEFVYSSDAVPFRQKGEGITKWTRLGNQSAKSMSASNDALWIISNYPDLKPMLWNAQKV